jgi:phenylpyruvate tautomerase PptA (4-oxalocrotonate tautomerase family)
MPMIDAFIPEGALEPEAETRLMEQLTTILLKHEGFDPTNQRARDVTLIFVHRPAAVYVAGTRATLPRYRIVPTVPEGQYSDEARKALVEEVTAAIARAEGGAMKDVGPRVWVFPTEIDDGLWGSRGVIRRLPDILAFLVGEHERPAAEAKLAARRRKHALAVLEAAADAARSDNATLHASPSANAKVAALKATG